MKSILALLLCCCAFSIQAQTITRQKGESSDSLVQRSLQANARNAGPVFEYTGDTSTIILYVQVQQQDTSKSVTMGSQTYQVLPDATFTFLCVLYSADDVHFSNRIVDTLDENSGCCPCWQPVTVSSFFFVNRDSDPEQEIGMLITQWVRPDCNSVTTSSVSIYDNIESFCTSGTLAKLEEYLWEGVFENELQEDQPVIPGRIFYDLESE